MGSTRKITLAAALLALLLLGAWLLHRNPGSPAPGATEDAATQQPAPADRKPPELLGRAEGDEPEAIPPDTSPPAKPEPTPGIATGIVRDEKTKAPIAGARVRIQLVRGELSEPLTKTTTDPDGRFRLDLRALLERPPLVVAAADVRVLVDATGYRPWHWALKRVADTSTRLIWEPLVVELKPGDAPSRLVVGRVLDPAGKPVASAQLRLRLVQPGRRPTHYGDTDVEGRFRVGVDSAGDYAGSVEKENVGKAFFQRFTVPDAGALDLGDLRLLGPGTISGVLRYPDGSPAAYAKAAAWAVPAEANQGVAPDPKTGLLTTRALGDKEGRFVLRGLAPGRYYVADAAEHPRAARSQPGDWPVHHTGDENVAVVVRGHRVVLRVRDEAGNPLPGATYSIRWKRSPEGDPLTDDRSAGNLQSADGILAIRGRPGERLEINVSAGEAGLAELVVEVRPDVWEVDRDVVLRPPPPETGTLRITGVVDGGGRPIGGSFVTVKTKRTGALVLYDKPLPEDGRFTGLAVGSYRLELTPGRSHRHRNDHMWFPIRHEFEIGPDQETRVALVARPGARIRMTVYGEGLELGRRGDLRRPLTCRAVRAGSETSLRLGSFLTDLEPGRWSSGSLHPGKPGLAWRLFEPGNYTLHVEHEGYRPIRREIRLDAGQVLDVEVRLERN